MSRFLLPPPQYQSVSKDIQPLSPSCFDETSLLPVSDFAIEVHLRDSHSLLLAPSKSITEFVWLLVKKASSFIIQTYIDTNSPQAISLINRFSTSLSRKADTGTDACIKGDDG